jgi:hypothetical protein
VARTGTPITGILRLARLTTAFAAVANLWFVVLWTRASAPERAGALLADGPLWLSLGGALVSGAALYGYGTALNDVVDMGRDRALRRDRPIPTGQATSDTAALTVAGTLILALLGASVLGPQAVMLTLLVALGIVAFNIAGKWVPGFGMVLLGLIYAGQMLAPNAELRFLWPVWLVMTHALVTSGVTHVLSGRPPRLTPRAVVFAVCGWAFASGVLLWLGSIRASADTVDGAASSPPLLTIWPGWVSPTAAIGPALLVVAFALLVARRVKKLGVGPRAAEKVGRYGALWLSLYGCAWLFGAGHVREGLIMSALALGGVIGMTLIREVYGLIEHPVGYRR